VLARKIASGLGRLECCRVRLDGDSAEPLAVADGRTLSTAVRAHGFVLVPSSSEGFAAGGEVIVHLYDQRY
jgi:molybdopterin biosynthesis enzyme